ncbi:MAG TPA: hypothetical protein VGB55_01305, partial [Tepidisphaeraceae bacterium]
MAGENEELKKTEGAEAGSDQEKGEARKPTGSLAATQPATQPANPDEQKRNQEMQYGIVGETMKTVTRSVPIDEPPPLGENAKLNSIGKSIPRL